MTDFAPEATQKPSKRVIMMAAIGLVAIGLSLFVLIPREPSYKGKSLSRWMIDVTNSSKTNALAELSKAVEGIGTNALPYLVDQLTYIEPSWRTKLRPAFSHLRFWSQIFPDHEKLKAPCLFALSIFGTNAVHALEAACGSSKPLIRARAANYLAMLNVQYSPTQRFKRRATHLLPNDFYDASVISFLTASLTHTDAMVRKASEDALVMFHKYEAARSVATANLLLNQRKPNTEEAMAISNALHRIRLEFQADARVK